MKCTLCNTEKPDHAKFCLNCGAQFGAEQASASTDILHRLAPKRYVDQLLASSGTVAGERRVVTMLFFDIKGSTAMAEKLDPEEVMEIMNAAFETLIDPIYRYEGIVARIMGDAVLAFFGAPIAHEDDPARACRAALEIIERAGEYADKLGTERGIAGFNVRVGINTGLVVVGEVGTDLRVEYTAMGDAVNLAKRMESAAEPGTVMITQNTQKLIAPLFETEDLGRIEVKGKTEPVAAYRLLRPRPERITDSAEAEPPIVGRDAELEELLAAVDELESSGGTCAVIGGAGHGKSRLVREARRAHVGGVIWAEGSCASYARNTSYWVARDLLHGLLGVEQNPDPADVRTALEESLEKLHTSDLERLRIVRARLSRLLDLTEDETRSGLEDMRSVVQSAFHDYISFLSRTQPVVLVWNDLHWIDPSSLELLETLIPLAGEIPLLMILVFRPGEKRVEDFHERMMQKHGKYYRVIDLPPLEREAGAQLLRGLLKDQTIPMETFDRILDHAEGNAFYLEEVVQSLRDAGLLDPLRTRALTAQQIKVLGIPTTLHGAIMAHIDCLPQEIKGVLQTASVIGRVFEPGVLAETLDPPPAEAKFAVIMLNLCERGLLECHDVAPGEASAGMPKDVSLWRTLPIQLPRAGRDPASGEARVAAAEYYFKNPALAEVTYNNMLKSQRSEIHRRAGEAIEKIHPDRREELAPVLAYHFEKGGENAKAVHYLVAVARRAARIQANKEAIAGFSKAITLAQNLSSEQGKLYEFDRALVHEELGDVMFVTSRYEEAIEQYEQARESSAEEEQRIRLLRKKGMTLEKWGKHAEAKACLEAIIPNLDEIHNETEKAYVYTGLGMTHYRLGELDQAAERCSRALDIMEQLGDERGIALACNNLAIIYCSMRQWDASLDLYRRSSSVWEEIGDMYGLAASHNNIGLALKDRGDTEQAIEHFEKSIEHFEQLGNKLGLARACDNIGQAYVELGKTEKATDYVNKAFTILTEIRKDKEDISPELWQSGAW